MRRNQNAIQKSGVADGVPDVDDFFYQCSMAT